jgi:UDP-glucose 4-epimerase
MSNLAAVKDRLEIREFDLTSEDLSHLLAQKQFTVICHVAANASVPISVEQPRMDFEKNLAATINILEAVRAASPGSLIIHTSSASVYGQACEVATREDDRAVPLSPYGVSKLASEHYMFVYAQLYGLRTASLRLFPVYGPRLRKQVVYDLMCKLGENPHELRIQGDGQQERDFNHVANVVEAFLIVAEKARFDGEVYNVASEETITIIQLARLISERVGASPRYVFGEARAGDTYRLKADISRLKGLGYHPRLELAEGLTDTVNWFIEESA